MSVLQNVLRPARSSRVVCLDLDVAHACAIEVAHGAVVHWSQQTHDGDGVDRGFAPDPIELGSQIRALLASAGITAKRARLTLPDQATVHRRLDLPSMPARHLARAVRFGAERALPIDLAQASWAWRVFRQDKSGYGVYVVAAWRDLIQRLHDGAAAAGLAVELIEPRSVAIGRAIELDSAIMLDEHRGEVQLTVWTKGLPTLFERMSDRTQGTPARLNQMLRRAVEAHELTDGGPRLPRVLVAGDMESDVPDLPLATRAASSLLNGHRPARPADFQPAHYLACLGLAAC